MYPSEKSPNFGVFVKNFEEGIQSEDVQIIDKTRQVYESISQHEIGIQKYDLSLKISI